MSTQACPEISTSFEDGVLEIAMVRPKQKNALTIAMYAAMTEALSEASRRADVRVVLIRGEGGNFTSGNDLRDFLENPPKGPEATVFQFMHAIATFTKPVIAAVDGFAVGIGTTMLFHCDLVYAAEDTKFMMPFVNLALVPEAGSTWLLTRQVGQRRAAELLYFAEPFDSETAMDVGLVSKIVPAADVLSHARTRARRLAEMSKTALARTKELMNEHQLGELRTHMDREANVFASMLGTPEVNEAIAAVLEKRKPDFSKLG